MEAEPPLPLSALEHHEYCPRQCALIHADGLWKENRHTVRGARGHRRVDQDRDRLERGHKVLRGLELWSERFHVIGRADAVEVAPDGTITPVEYKIGTRHGQAAHVQLCAQALCLEEMLRIRVSHGAIWYSGPRERVQVELDHALRERTITAIQEIQQALRRGSLPIAVNDQRCAECQLLDHCLPTLTDEDGPMWVRTYLESEVWQCDS